MPTDPNSNLIKEIKTLLEGYTTYQIIAVLATQTRKLQPLNAFIPMYWTANDVQHQAYDNGIELNEEQVFQVMDLIDQKFDAEIGINWDVISDRIGQLFPPKK